MRPCLSLLSAFVLLLVSACGGGGGDDQDNDAGSPARVLIVEAVNHDDDRTDMVNKLTGFGAFAAVDTFDAFAATPTPALLATYDAVLVMSDRSFADPAALGDVLADFVDAGGALVVAMFAVSSDSAGGLLQGRFEAERYYTMSTSAVDGSQTNGGMTPVDGGHPILQGVSSFDGGTLSFAPTAPTLAPDAQLIATWDDPAATPLVVTRSIGGTRRVDLGFHPVTADGRNAGFLDPASDAMLIVANALRWASNRL